MSNVVEYIVKIRDLASGPMRSFASNTEGAFSLITSRVNRVGGSVDQLNEKLNRLTKQRNTSINLSNINKLNNEIDGVQRKIDRLTNAKGGQGGMGLIGGGLLLGGITAVAALGGKAISAGMDRQLAGKSFEVMAGKKQGQELHKNLIGFATDTIYGNEVFGEAKTMLSFGVAAKNIMPAMKMLGDVAMGDAEHMKSLSLAFAQTTAAGKLRGQDNLQYNDAGFSPLQALHDKTGRSMADLSKDMEKGKISAIMVADAFKYATGPMGRFHNGMKRMGETPTGKIMAFKGAMETLAGTIGTQLLPALGGMVDFMNWMGAHQSLMYGIAAGIGAMTAAWALYTAWTQRAAIWQGILAVIAFWPVAVIGLLVGAVVWLVKSFDGWGKSLGALWQITKGVFSVIGLTFKDSFQQWMYYLELFYYKAKGVFQYIGNLAANVANAMRLALSGDFSGARKALTAHITTDTDKQIDGLKSTRAGQSAQNMLAISSNLSQLGSQWKNVGLTRTKEAGKSHTAADALTSRMDMKGLAGGGASASGGLPGGVADTAKGITGGGVRNLTINIAKQGVDQITIHAASVTEGAAEIRDVFIQMFNQVINSGNAVVSPN